MSLKLINKIAGTASKAYADSQKPKALKKPKVPMKAVKPNPAEEAAESPEYEAAEEANMAPFKKSKK